MKLLNFFKTTKSQKAETEVGDLLNKDFLKGIALDDNPFEAETPDDIQIYDLDGNEVDE